jgi:predicted protein tyrosine phosphatase
MSSIVVSPLSHIAEMAVRHKAREMISLLAENQNFHRPAVITADRHLTLGMNDITFAGTGKLIAPQDVHVRAIIDFARSWNQSAPMLIHCWMGVSRSPAAAMIASLAIFPEDEDQALAIRLRQASPFATPNIRLVQIADDMLERKGSFVDAVKKLGRGQDADGSTPFVLPLPNTEKAPA